MRAVDQWDLEAATFWVTEDEDFIFSLGFDRSFIALRRPWFFSQIQTTPIER